MPVNHTRKKPVIGCVPLVDYGRESLWMLPGYFDGIVDAGGVPVMLPLTDDLEAERVLVDGIDGLLVTGGQDLEPVTYGERGPEAGALCGELSRERDRMELRLIPLAVEAGLPVLGICRGIQALNVALGGTLWQDLPKQYPSDVVHHGTPPYELPTHEVEVLARTPLAELVGAGTLPVNSYHHQAVRELGDGLRVMATAPDGVIEAIWRPESRFFWGVQWHPELSRVVDESSRKIFSAFVGAARG